MSLLGRGCLDPITLFELGVEAGDVLQRDVWEFGAGLQMRQPELAIQRVALREFHRYLKLRPPGGSTPAEQVGRTDVEGGCQIVHQTQLRLSLAVLNVREVRSGPSHDRAELVERQAFEAPEMAEPPSKCEQVDGNIASPAG